MTLTKKQSEEFKELSEKLIKFLNENTHPHCTIVIDSTHAELLEGISSTYTEKYLLD